MAEFIYAYDLDGGERRTKVYKSGGAIAKGVVGVLSSGALQKAASGANSGVVGVTVDVADAAGQEVEVITNRRAVFKCEYTGNTTLTDSHLGTKFDYDPTTNKLDVDDTTDGFLILVAYNEHYAWVMIDDSVRAV